MNDELEFKELDQTLPEDDKNLMRVEYRDISQRITSIKVTNEQTYKDATALAVRNKDVLKRIEQLRKLIVKPFQDAVKNTNDLLRKLARKFEANQEKIDQALARYLATRKNTESVQNVHTDCGRATIVKRMTFKVTDPDLVPREWMCPDEVKIGRAVRARTVKEIPGVKIWEVTDTAYSTK